MRRFALLLAVFLSDWKEALAIVTPATVAGFCGGHGLEEQEGVLAIGDPLSAEAHPHPPTQWLNV